MGIPGRGGGHSDDKKLLVLEGGDNGGLVVVVNWGDEDALREFVAAVFAGKGRDCVFSGFKEGSGDVRSNGASGLRVFVSAVVYVVLLRGLLTPTIAILSMAFLKPTGWFLAYLGILAIFEQDVKLIIGVYQPLRLWSNVVVEVL